MASIQHPICVHRGFQILNFQNSLLILYLMEKYVFNSTMHQILATIYENCFALLCAFVIWLNTLRVLPMDIPTIVVNFFLN